MSIILDALRKSESDRLRDSEARLTETPHRRRSSRTPVWILVVAGLLAANIAVLLWLVLRPTTPTVTPPSITGGQRTLQNLKTLANSDVPGAQGAPAPRSGTRRTPDLPPAQFPVPVDPEEVPSAPTLAERVADAVAAEKKPALPLAAAPVTAAALPTLAALPATVSAGWPALEVSLHYFDGPTGRSFITINGRTARDGATLIEGPLVEQVTEEGAILRYRGQRFLLPRN